MMNSDDRNETPSQVNPLEQTTSSLNNTQDFFVNFFHKIKFLSCVSFNRIQTLMAAQNLMKNKF